AQPAVSPSCTFTQLYPLACLDPPITSAVSPANSWAATGLSTPGSVRMLTASPSALTTRLPMESVTGAGSAVPLPKNCADAQPVQPANSSSNLLWPLVASGPCSTEPDWCWVSTTTTSAARPGGERRLTAWVLT